MSIEMSTRTRTCFRHCGGSTTALLMSTLVESLDPSLLKSRDASSPPASAVTAEVRRDALVVTRRDTAKAEARSILAGRSPLEQVPHSSAWTPDGRKTVIDPDRTHADPLHAGASGRRPLRAAPCLRHYADDRVLPHSSRA